MFKKTLLIVSVLIFSRSVFSQISFDIRLEALQIENLGGLQSYTYGVQDNNWLVFGGRLDGLHLRQPFASFAPSGNNNQIILIDIVQGEVWKRSIDELPVNIKEQLSSTNMQFHQRGDKLIITGGYAYSATAGDHITFPFLTVVDLPSLLESIKKEQSITSSFVQTRDEKFAVAGGQLKSINDVFYLVGGHKFTGRYNPHGPDHGPGFSQEYTHEIRPFELDFSDEFVSITHLVPFHDERHFRRRDYNLVPTIQNGKEGLMIFSGVFQKEEDLPWLYPISISENSYEAHEDFVQYFNHYHCAVAPIYEEHNDQMNSLFFGGIAQFYMENGILVQDDDVPFVNTIAMVTRDADGAMIENKMTSEMPGYFGASSEFILDPNFPVYDNGVIIGDSIKSEEVLIGYIYGGIKSSEKNIFWINDGSQSEATKSIFKVYISKRNTSQTINAGTNNQTAILVYPNPTTGEIRIKLNLEKVQNISLEIFEMNGEAIVKDLYDKTELTEGINYLSIKNVPKLRPGGYLIKVRIDDQFLIRKFVVGS